MLGQSRKSRFVRLDPRKVIAGLSVIAVGLLISLLTGLIEPGSVLSEQPGDVADSARPENGFARGSRSTAEPPGTASSVGRVSNTDQYGNPVRVGAGSVEAYIAAAGVHGGSASGAANSGDPWNPDADARQDVDGGADAAPDEAEVESAEQQIPRDQFIGGRVISDSGMPLANIGLVATAARLFDVPDGESILLNDHKRQEVSDGGGRFAFRQLAAGDYRIRTLRTTNYAPGQISVRAGTESADIVLAGEQEVRVSGQVTSTDGEPITAALVVPKVAGARGDYTDEYGRFLLQIPLKLDTGFAVQAARKGYKEQVVLVAKSAVHSEIPLDIRLETLPEPSVVMGTVLDSSGGPVAGKGVQLFSSANRQRYQTSTDRNGQFVIFGVVGGDDYQLRIPADRLHHEYFERSLLVDAAGLDLRIGLLPQETGTLSGRVVDVNGDPIPNFTLELRSQNMAGNSIRVTADGAGDYFVSAAPSGQLILETRSMPRFNVSGIEVVPGGDVEAPVVIDLGNHELRGYVVDSHGNPVVVPQVNLWWFHTHNGIRSWASRQTAADAQGYFIFSQLGPGRHTVRIDVPGYEPADLTHDFTTDGYELVVQLEEKS